MSWGNAAIFALLVVVFGVVGTFVLMFVLEFIFWALHYVF